MTSIYSPLKDIPIPTIYKCPKCLYLFNGRDMPDKCPRCSEQVKETNEVITNDKV